MGHSPREWRLKRWVVGGVCLATACVLVPGDDQRPRDGFRGTPPDGGASDRLATHFAVIGDYGLASANEAAVADLVASLQPDFIVTLGDNNYVLGGSDTIDANIGQYYHDYIFPYSGGYGGGADRNRFFPALGNHDWETAGAAPYLDYFALPGNERYYDVVQGDVHLYAIDSDPGEPDGVSADSPQAEWLRLGLAASTASWRIVYMHHPPFSSGYHGSNAYMQWPYAAWGADLVLAGHDHIYERLEEDGLTYVVNGLGGAALYEGITPVAGSVVQFKIPRIVIADNVNFGGNEDFLRSRGVQVDIIPDEAMIAFFADWKRRFPDVWNGGVGSS